VADLQNGAGHYGLARRRRQTQAPANRAVRDFVPSTECPTGNPAVRAVRNKQKKEEKKEYEHP